MSFERTLLILVIKYVLEGMAVGVAAYLIGGGTKKGLQIDEIMGIALTASMAFAVLDFFAPAVAMGLRQGAGFGLGARQVGWMGEEAFVDTGCIIPEGTAVRNTLGAIMLMKQGVLRPFTSMEHYQTWGSPSYQEMDDATLERCKIGDPLEPAPDAVEA